MRNEVAAASRAVTSERGRHTPDRTIRSRPGMATGAREQDSRSSSPNLEESPALQKPDVVADLPSGGLMEGTWPPNLNPRVMAGYLKTSQ
jgi:hypothetical protein